MPRPEESRDQIRTGDRPRATPSPARGLPAAAPRVGNVSGPSIQGVFRGSGCIEEHLKRSGPLRGNTDRSGVESNVALIDHIDLGVGNLEKIVKLCCDSSGCELERGPGEFRLAQLGDGPSLIDLVDAGCPTGPSAAASRSQSRKQATFRVEARPGRQNAVYSRPASRTSGR